MSNGKPPPFRIRRATPVEGLQIIVSSLIDFTLAMAAMDLEAGTFTAEQLAKMESIMGDFRKKAGKSFNFIEGMQAVRAAFRIEIQGERKKEP